MGLMEDRLEPRRIEMLDDLGLHEIEALGRSVVNKIRIVPEGEVLDAQAILKQAIADTVQHEPGLDIQIQDTAGFLQSLADRTRNVSDDPRGANIIESAKNGFN